MIAQVLKNTAIALTVKSCFLILDARKKLKLKLLLLQEY
jgi:hypothetical protein